jgi:YYY domain-containing protein
MFQFILWYLTITLLGLLTFPLAYRLFPALADRGYSLSRALGLLLWGFVFWLSVSFGITRNEVGGLLFALAVVVGLSVWAIQTKDEGQTTEAGQTSIFGRLSFVNWIKSNLRLVLSVETLFLVAFALWAFVRANNPDTTGTEKPMEIAFINAILRSPTFPPHDPWLSGYGISYYYFGYVLASMLAMITATNGGMTFNLMLSLVFGLSIIGSYGLLYNLLNAYWRTTDEGQQATSPVHGLWSALGAFFAPLFLVILSNVEGFLELLHSYGIGWAGAPGDVNLWTKLQGISFQNPTAYNFWTWLTMKDLSDAPHLPFGWNPRFWFWWRASRILHDYDLRGFDLQKNFTEIIDEFPFFSYLLGDLHPHVLAMPFGLLAVALALNLYLGGWKGETNFHAFKLPVRKEGLAVLAVVLGGLAFLNTWDFPIYLAVVTGAFILSLVNERGWGWELIEDFFKFSIPMAIVSIVLYLPFYISFSSQAGGLLPNVIFPTRGAYIWIMFGTLLVPLALFLGSLLGKCDIDWLKGFLLTIGVTLFLWVFSVVLGVFASQTEAGRAFVSSQGLSSTSDVLREATLRRLQFGAGLLTLVLIIGMALSYLTAAKAQGESESTAERSPIPFVLMFILFGGLLVMAPEFVYLRDQFGSRMNTVFKFYYQAWALWSLAAAFGFVVLVKELRGVKLGLFAIVMAAVLVVGLTYPALSLPNKTDNFNAANPDRRTLDGAAYLGAYNPDDYAAIQWLTQAPLGIVVEAVGGSYSEFARVATYSGQPTVLGWPGHESQWRGGYNEMGNRGDDIKRLYETANWDEANAILKQYEIHYVYIGPLESTTYTMNEEKFARNLAEIYRHGQVVIYEVP